MRGSLRADIKSYYKSIQHHLLIDDIKQYYSDPHVQQVLENIIKNPIETPRGFKNSDNGIALRGPLSQFFSALYLKPLDDAFDSMEVTYLRYQQACRHFLRNLPGHPSPRKGQKKATSMPPAALVVLRPSIFALNEQNICLPQ